ncbi:MAG: phospho-sugar mutase [Thermotogae bacterium]|nr:phospho-sugar mutase [Thermotogota bacterium]
MEDIKVKSYEVYSYWLKNVDENSKKELELYKGNDKEIIDRFYRDLEFGTGGMRGKIGTGSNRMNSYTVARATQGFADYLKQEKKDLSVVIAYDTRHKSPEFSEVASEVFAANGIKVYLFSEQTATPILSYAVRHLKADGGLVITASHNPKEYNGYKVYTSDGTQAVPKYAEIIINEVNKLDYFTDVKRMNFDEAVKSGMVTVLDDTVYNDYIQEIYGFIQTLNPKINKDLKFIYSPLHGTGYRPVMEILEKLGVNVIAEPSQAKPDPDFSTVSYPNPEDKGAFKLGIELAEKENADIICATDPDSDRIGVFEKSEKGYITFNGNEMGIMLSHFILTKLKEQKKLPQNGLIIKTIVSTDMIFPIAADFGVSVEQTLTGFKFIGERMEYYHCNGNKKYIFGFEESYGSLAGDHARDKDAVIAAALIAVMTSELKNKKMTLKKYLDTLYKKYGFFKESLLSYTFEGYEGVQKIKNIMSKMKKEPPVKISGIKLTESVDYNVGIEELPKSDVVELRYSGKIKLIARPSGTEPKIKFYIMVNSPDEKTADEIIKQAELTVGEFVN